ncbi:MAG: tRNA (5-methylaminomethyl-2-thiouridine)(34)-methyltransferase MnmD [Crocinitomicaceae bacterium]|nr:tRNA (5-methylaminomethyl-2-thiouridine)(34)-methyltransferase MnmD [Crocinitomicaceae bacterium]
MKSKIIVTDDNSKTLLIPALNETYHSTKGAITEALHVFIKEGIQHLDQKELCIFEMGFGTGLNAILTLDYALKNKIKVDYQCIEAHPLNVDTILEMNYLTELGLEFLNEEYLKMHSCPSDHHIQLSNNFGFTKHLSQIEDQTLSSAQYDLIFYDAFGPKVQPHLWQEGVLSKIVKSMKPGAVLVTYCAQGAFKRTLKQLGLEVESIPGPPGKREMTRATKNF